MVSNLNLLESRRCILLTTPHLESPTPANPLTFKSNMSAKLKEGKVYFTPVQEGTGDPSPDNVRPILGWDGITVTKCGKNLLNPNDPDFGQYTVSPTGEQTIGNDRITTRFISCEENVVVTASGIKKYSNNKVFNFAVISAWDKDKKYISRAAVNASNSITLITPPDTKYIRFSEQIGGRTKVTPSIFEEYGRQLEFGSTPTVYEPYTETKITIPFPQTIYGGYVDLVNGEVVEKWKQTIVDENSTVGIFPWHGVKIDSATGTEYATALFRRANDCPKGHNLASNLCDKLPYSTSYNKINCAYFYDGDTYGPAISLPTSLIGTTNETLKQYLSENSFVFCYQLLCTPIHHTIDPQVIRPLKGVNNIWSDANGNIEIKFWKH